MNTDNPPPTLDLREFFAHLDADAFFSQINAMAEANSQVEVDQTTREATRVIPLLADILARKKEADAEFDYEQSRLWLGVALPLIACFRIAEDLGYDWHPAPPRTGPQGPRLP